MRIRKSGSQRATRGTDWRLVISGGPRKIWRESGELSPMRPTALCLCSPVPPASSAPDAGSAGGRGKTSLPAGAPKPTCHAECSAPQHPYPGAGGAGYMSGRGGEGLTLEWGHWQREGSLIWGTLTEALLSARHCRKGRHHLPLRRQPLVAQGRACPTVGDGPRKPHPGRAPGPCHHGVTWKSGLCRCH